jgi:Zn-dependent protease
VSFLILEFSGVSIGSGIAYTILSEMILINLGFGVFNLIPIPPLDGSRVLYVLMPDGVREFMRKMEPFGIYIIYILIVIGGGFFSVYMSEALNWILNGFYWIIGK